MAALGRKSLGGSGEIIKNGAIEVETALAYAMSLPVATTLGGMELLEVLEQNLVVARGFKALSSVQMDQIRNATRDLAADGRYELYKTTKKYDAEIGRQQHGFPTVKMLPV